MCVCMCRVRVCSGVCLTSALCCVYVVDVWAFVCVMYVYVCGPHDAQDRFLEVELDSGEQIIMDAAKARDSNPRIMRRYDQV